VLAFDTATSATAVALVDDEAGLQLEARDDPPAGSRPNHASRLLALIEDLLARSGDGWPAVDRLAVGIGPGTFTGLRIGVATAQALARAREIPVVGVSTLSSLALAARDHAAERPHAAVIDARRGEVFVAAWAAAADPGGDPPQLAPVALPPLEFGERLPAGLAVGDGAVRFRAILERAGLAIPPDDSDLHRVSAAWHCRLARTAVPGGPDAVQPSYLRRPDAERSRSA
jgi:tRNA threonylcarbamoyladenosine biosynthesis protein TsaB